jgi:hypothetical protein
MIQSDKINKLNNELKYYRRSKAKDEAKGVNLIDWDSMINETSEKMALEIASL